MSMEIYTSIIVPIILGLIASVGAVVVAIINTKQAKKTDKKIDENQLENELNNIRQQILILISDDKVCRLEGGLPSNYKAICDLYDKYKALGGNSYIKAKTQKYFDWINSLEVKEN